MLCCKIAIENEKIVIISSISSCHVEIIFFADTCFSEIKCYNSQSRENSE